MGRDTHSGQDLKRRVRAMASADLNAEIYDFSDEPLEEPLWIKKFKNGKTIVRAYDPLFAVNQKCMRLRSSVSRLRNDFWGYTRKVENLQYHLWIVIAVMNGWKLPKWK